jgi:hypothetical protein
MNHMLLTIVLLACGGEPAPAPDVTAADAPAEAAPAAPPTEAVSPCLDPIKVIAQIPPLADVVKIDRHFPDGRVENTSIKAFDVRKIGYEARLLPDGRLCSAVWIIDRKGTSHLFDSDADTDLRPQAQRIASGMSKPLDVLHLDELPTPGPK